MLGSYLCEHLIETGYEVIKGSRNKSAEVDIRNMNPGRMKQVLLDQEPDIVINLIAMTDVDRCEKEVENACQSNIQPILTIKAALGGLDHIRVVHLSTDQVYSKKMYNTESDAAPINVYGRTKLQAEMEAKSMNSLILRTNYVGRSRIEGRQSFTDWFVDACESHKSISLFNDVFFSPLFATTLCRMIARAIEHNLTGVYNLGSKESISKAEFCMILARYLSLDTSNIKLTSTTTRSSAAIRPKWMGMDSKRFQEATRIETPNILGEIEQLAKQYRKS